MQVNDLHYYREGRGWSGGKDGCGGVGMGGEGGYSTECHQNRFKFNQKVN